MPETNRPLIAQSSTDTAQNVDAAELLSAEEVRILRLVALALGRPDEVVKVRREMIMRLADEVTGGGTYRAGTATLPPAVPGSGRSASGAASVNQDEPPASEAAPDGSPHESSKTPTRHKASGPAKAKPKAGKPRNSKQGKKKSPTGGTSGQSASSGGSTWLTRENSPVEIAEAIREAGQRNGWQVDTELPSNELAEAIGFHSMPGKDDRPGVSMYQWLQAQGVAGRSVEVRPGKPARRYSFGEIDEALPVRS